MHIQASSTKRAVSKKSDRDASMPVLKKWLSYASQRRWIRRLVLQCERNDRVGCSCCATRLVTVDLKELSKSGDSRRSGVLSAAREKLCPERRVKLENLPLLDGTVRLFKKAKSLGRSVGVARRLERVVRPK